MVFDIISLASKLHDREYYSELFERYADLLSSSGLRVTPPFTSPDEAPEPSKEGVVILLLTGGTSRLAFSLASKTGSAVLIAHASHNSLPSALSAKARLEATGRNVIVEYADHPEELDASRISRYLRAFKAASALQGLKVAYLDSDEQHGQASLFYGKLGMVVEPVSTNTIREAFGHVLSSGEALRMIPERLKEHPMDGLERAAAVYLALKDVMDEGGYTYGIIDCFRFLDSYRVTPCLAISLLNSEGYVVACEADLYSLLIMHASIKIMGVPGWIANPATIRDEKLILAHCTAPMKLAQTVSLMPHFETGLPLAISASLRRGMYTMTRVGLKLDRLAATRVVVEASGFLSSGMCRTQAEIKLVDTSVQGFLDRSLGNHHVLIPGDIRRELRAFAGSLDMRYEEY